MAPEQARGEGLDARADQFSLAALTYLLLAGRAPYDHSSLTAAADPAPAAPMGGGLPEEVEAVVHRGLAADREERYPDVPAYVAALTAAVGAAGDGSFDGADEAPTAWIPPDAGLHARAPGSSRPEPVSGEVRTIDSSGPRSAAGGRSSASRPWCSASSAATRCSGATGHRRARWSTPPRTISVTVPEAWTSVVDDGAGRPPDSDTEFAGDLGRDRRGVER